jgi:toxin ParE1/3/4
MALRVRESYLSSVRQGRCHSPVPVLSGYQGRTRGCVGRFRQAVRLTVESLREHPRMAPRYPLRNRRVQSLRAWSVAGFEAVRVYYVVEDDVLRVIRILHGKRNVRRILEREKF